ncbi:hypothetical protein EFQ99_07690 [Rhizobium vallis]|uniref:Uncharacterized protein n=1 Tax=Rhizobium vallis TaxID=634290 RepID=A0A3S0QWS1_9HYPH|nr:hypothetical protein [Rhizobium vallis]RUM26151.1 hypothetical protein EFQ99_07690 [Rhizobium vallis]
MNWTRLAAALMGLTLLIHVYAGGSEVYDPLQAALPDEFLAAFAAILWHAVTVVLAVIAGGLWILAQRHDPALEAILSAIQLGLAALFIFYGLTRLGTVIPMPQWIIFLAIPVLTRFGQRGRKKPQRQS